MKITSVLMSAATVVAASQGLAWAQVQPDYSLQLRTEPKFLGAPAYLTEWTVTPTLVRNRVPTMHVTRAEFKVIVRDQNGRVLDQRQRGLDDLEIEQCFESSRGIWPSECSLRAMSLPIAVEPFACNAEISLIAPGIGELASKQTIAFGQCKPILPGEGDAANTADFVWAAQPTVIEQLQSDGPYLRQPLRNLLLTIRNQGPRRAASLPVVVVMYGRDQTVLTTNRIDSFTPLERGTEQSLQLLPQITPTTWQHACRLKVIVDPSGIAADANRTNNEVEYDVGYCQEDVRGTPQAQIDLAAWLQASPEAGVSAHVFNLGNDTAPQIGVPPQLLLQTFDAQGNEITRYQVGLEGEIEGYGGQATRHWMWNPRWDEACVVRLTVDPHGIHVDLDRTNNIFEVNRCTGE